MEPALATLAGVWLGLCLLKAVQLRLLNRLLTKYRILPLSLQKSGAAELKTESQESPHVQVIIPARNEQENLSRCLDGLLAQTYPTMSILVVDDRSEDRTRDIAAEYAQRHPQVEVLSISDLPPDWMGKAHAMWKGAQQKTEGDWLLFVDADVLLHPEAVATTLQKALSEKAEMLTVWTRSINQGFWSSVLMPLCGAMLGMWFDCDKVNDPASSVGFANGQFVLISRRVYQQVGGHSVVRQHIIEDIPFGEHVKRQGHTCHLGYGFDLVGVDMYTSLSGVMNGFARILIGGLRSANKALVSALMLTVGSIWPVIAMGLLLVLVGSKAASSGLPAAFDSVEEVVFSSLAGTHFLLTGLFAMRLWQVAGYSSLWVFLYPLSIFVVLVILLRVWWKLSWGSVIHWRGRSYQVNSKGEIVMRV